MHRAMTIIAILGVGGLSACGVPAPTPAPAPAAVAQVPAGQVPNQSTLLQNFNTTIVMSERSAVCLEFQRIVDDPASLPFERQRARDAFNQKDCVRRSTT